MELDVAQIATAVMPYATAVVAAYGKDTVAKIRDSVVDRASDETVSLGHRLLNRMLHRDQSREAIEGALVDVASGEEGGEAALRLQIRKALAADSELVREVAGMLAPATHIEAFGRRAIATGTNTGIASTGDYAVNIGAQHNHGSGTFIGRDYYDGVGAPDTRNS